MKSLPIVLALALGAGGATLASAADPFTKGKAAEYAPDNTGRNVRDRGNTPTSGNQSEKKPDRDLTQQIRKAVVADKGLSMKAHNVKIITVGGVVTLRGPVATEDERTSVAAKAEQLAGAGNVHNQLEVTK